MNSGVLATLTSAISAFIATNIDDLLLLTLLFTQALGPGQRQRIVLGQYLGFAALILASLPGFFGGQVISQAWIGLLGLVPIALGISQWLKPADSETEVQGVNFDATSEIATADVSRDRPLPSFLQGWLHPQVYGVAAITIANGGDNIGIYVPLFASSDRAQFGVTLFVFFSLVGVWCYLAHQLARHRTVAKILARYGNTFVPIVFIGLGVFIILESGTLALFISSQ